MAKASRWPIGAANAGLASLDLSALSRGPEAGLFEVLSDKTGAAAACFMLRALAWFSAQRIKVKRITSDNGSPYVSKCFAEMMRQSDLEHLRTRPYTPKTNGKAERFIQTLLREWAYAKAYASSGRRNGALTPFTDRNNRRRPHASLAGRTPVAALQIKS
jgi:transposase InsO family protein